VDRDRRHHPRPGLAAVAIGSMGIRVACWFGPDYPYTAEAVADGYADLALKQVG
jgi:Tetracyclin repressor-like, C-terminal domain